LDEWEQRKVQIALVVLLCMSAAVAEAAQTYKYNKKLANFSQEFNFNELNKIDPAYLRKAYGWFGFYAISGCVTAVFTGMAAFELLEYEMNEAALLLVALYALLSMPYLWKKAEEQVCETYAPPKTTPPSTSSTTIFYGARVGNIVGEIAFAFFGFYESMKKLHMVEAPKDILDSDSMMILSMLVVVAAVASSWIMTAGGNRPGHRDKINEIESQMRQKGLSFQSPYDQEAYDDLNRPMSEQILRKSATMSP
jgi:hypothetical protein